MRNLTRGIRFAVTGTVLLGSLMAQSRTQPDVSLDTTNRSVTSASFAVTWNTGVDTEAVTALGWMGANETEAYERRQCLPEVSGQILPAGVAQVTINSSSTSCAPTSTGVNVQTTYRFPQPRNSVVNWFQVHRVFDFTNTAFTSDIRPFLPRLS